jgi:hypothetical protein
MTRREYRLRAALPTLWLIVIMIASGARSLFAQPSGTTPSDTTGRAATIDSLGRASSPGDTLGADTTASVPQRSDTARLFAYAGTLGSAAGDRQDAAYRFVTLRDLVHRRYFTAFDILAPLLPAYPLSQGTPGLVRSFSYAGAAPGSICALYNGRQLPGDVEGGYDLELYPTEFIDRIEIVRGARATLLGNGESLIALNFVQPRYDIEGSYVRLAYTQGLYNSTSADITYSRNIGNSSNLTLGMRRLPGDGEFPNQGVSNTIIRGAYTINPGDGVVFSLSEIYATGTRGLNGGLDPTSERDPRTLAVVNNTALVEEQLRHDITLSARLAPRPKSDSLSTDSGSAGKSPAALDGALYYSYLRRDLTGMADSLLRPGEWRKEIVGARAAASLPAGPLRAEINAVAEYGASGFADSLDGNAGGRVEVGGLGELSLGAVLLRGGAKVAAGDHDTIRTTFVGEGILGISEAFSARGTVRLFNGGGDAVPTGGARGFSDVPTRLLGEAAVEFDAGNTQIGVDAFYRQTREPAVSTYGAGGHLRLPLAFLVLDARLLGQSDPDGGGRFPTLYSKGDLFGEWKLFKENLDLRVGTTVVYQTGLRGAEYDALAGEPTFPTDTARALSTQNPNLGLYAQARIGSAYIRAGFENILDIEQWTLYRYPINGRGLHLQVTWVLVD